MRVEDQGKLLRIYVDEGAKHGGQLLYEAIVRLCRDRGLVEHRNRHGLGDRPGPGQQLGYRQRHRPDTPG